MLTLFAAACVVALAIAGGTVRAAAAAPTATAPNLALIAIGPADLKGAKVARQKYVKNPDVVASYEREFKEGASIGHGLTLLLENDIDAFATAAGAHTDYVGIKKLFGSKAGRALFTAGILSDAKKEEKKKGSAKVTFGRMQSLGAGGETFFLPVTVTLSSIRFPVAISVTRADRVESTLFVMGFPRTKIVPADIAKLQRIVAGHVATAFTPTSTGLPTITGAAIPGQVLTGADGTWTNEPTSFTRSWLRCDAAGANCAAIAGATTSSYTVQPGDAGLTIRYSVVATNASGTSKAAASAQVTVGPAPLTPVPPPQPT